MCSAPPLSRPSQADLCLTAFLPPLMLIDWFRLTQSLARSTHITDDKDAEEAQRTKELLDDFPKFFRYIITVLLIKQRIANNSNIHLLMLAIFVGIVVKKTTFTWVIKYIFQKSIFSTPNHLYESFPNANLVRWDDMVMQFLVSGTIIVRKLSSIDSIEDDYVLILLAPLMKMACLWGASIITWKVTV